MQNQNLQLDKMSFGRYSIKSKKANKYITIKDNRCVLYEKNSSMPQIFQFVIKNNYCSIMNPKTKNYLTLSDCSDQNGAPILNQQATEIQEKSQQFEIHNVFGSSSQVVIFTFCGKCFDCCQESTKNGTQIIQWDFHGSDNQKWILENA